MNAPTSELNRQPFGTLKDADALREAVECLELQVDPKEVAHIVPLLLDLADRIAAQLPEAPVAGKPETGQ